MLQTCKHVTNLQLTIEVIGTSSSAGGPSSIPLIKVIDEDVREDWDITFVFLQVVKHHVRQAGEEADPAVLLLEAYLTPAQLLNFVPLDFAVQFFVIDFTVRI